MTDRWRAFGRRARGYRALRRHPVEARALLAEREALRDEARRLEALLSDVGAGRAPA